MSNFPGVTADQIKIGLTNTKLRIWGEKKRRPNRRRIISYLCSERSFGKFGRVVPLRWTVQHSRRNRRTATACSIFVFQRSRIEEERRSW